MATSNENASNDQPRPTKPASDTVNLTADDLRKISGGTKVGLPIPAKTPTTPPPGGTTPIPQP